jgi:hypothetical protein
MAFYQLSDADLNDVIASCPLNPTPEQHKYLLDVLTERDMRAKVAARLSFDKEQRAHRLAERERRQQVNRELERRVQLAKSLAC